MIMIIKKSVNNLNIINTNKIKNNLVIFVKNGFYIHFFNFLFYYLTNNFYLSTIICIKFYSVNYFYWYGTLFSYLPNKRHNWVKQFIRFTDTGHLASFLPLIYPKILPVSHNIHFTIMIGYWLGKLVFKMEDADRIETNDIILWHMDLCTYIHHSIPYMLIYLLSQNYEVIFNYNSLIHSYIWLYSWFIFIYLPWKFYTNDPVYSVLDLRQTSKTFVLGFIAFIHIIIYLSNLIGFYILQ